MSITVNQDDKNNTVTISLIGSFDFSLFNDFRAAYTDLDGNFNRYVIDMSSVEYLDSAALGMLLSMRNAIPAEQEIDLKGANAFIKNILMISRFDKRFNII
ncbi:STAS domain-containing protein [Marinomonas posidonica]|uniref:STAS domain-containing protein n=1 Tax=Marinomonas posidonica TaxID=936476 RepID=UPI003736444E